MSYDVTGDAGRVLLITKGDYDSTTTYSLLDVVRHSDKSWVSKIDNNTYEPTAQNNAYWFMLASDGPRSIGVDTPDTLLASNWSNSQYSLETDYPYSTYQIAIGPAQTATLAQIKAFGNAMLSSQNGANVLIANGTVPTVDIPVIVNVLRK